MGVGGVESEAGAKELAEEAKKDRAEKHGWEDGRGEERGEWCSVVGDEDEERTRAQPRLLRRPILPAPVPHPPTMQPLEPTQGSLSARLPPTPPLS